jgi:hypothetical protein
VTPGDIGALLGRIGRRLFQQVYVVRDRAERLDELVPQGWVLPDDAEYLRPDAELLLA